MLFRLSLEALLAAEPRPDYGRRPTWFLNRVTLRGRGFFRSRSEDCSGQCDAKERWLSQRRRFSPRAVADAGIGTVHLPTQFDSGRSICLSRDACPSIFLGWWAQKAPHRRFVAVPVLGALMILSLRQEAFWTDSLRLFAHSTRGEARSPIQSSQLWRGIGKLMPL